MPAQLLLGCNSLTAIPNHALEAMCLTLSVLDLSENQLCQVPPSIFGMKNLKRLDLRMNNIRTLPPQLGFVTSLLSIATDGNPIRAMRRDILKQPISVLLEYLRDRANEPAPPTCSESSIDATDVAVEEEWAPKLAPTQDEPQVDTATDLGPSSIDYTDDVTDENNNSMLCNVAIATASSSHPSDGTTISCAQKKIAHRQAELALELRLEVTSEPTPAKPAPEPLQAVAVDESDGSEEVSLAGQRLQGLLGAAVWRAHCSRRLLKLDLSNNELTELDADMFRATPLLEYLNLDRNRLTNVPASLASCSRLSHLSMQRNLLKLIPDPVIELVALRSLNLSGNYITELPRRAWASSSLQTLCVSVNRISSLGAADLKWLRSLQVRIGTTARALVLRQLISV